MALYNAGYPATYQPLYQPYVQAQQPAQQQVQGSLNWIQGEQAAKSYLVAPNSSVVLFDSESQSIYIKSADASGMPSMKVLDYTIRETGKTASNSPVVASNDNLSGYATKSEIEAISAQITALREKVNALTAKRKEEKTNE